MHVHIEQLTPRAFSDPSACTEWQSVLAGMSPSSRQIAGMLPVGLPGASLWQLGVINVTMQISGDNLRCVRLQPLRHRLLLRHGLLQDRWAIGVANGLGHR